MVEAARRLRQQSRPRSPLGVPARTTAPGLKFRANTRSALRSTSTVMQPGSRWRSTAHHGEQQEADAEARSRGEGIATVRLPASSSWRTWRRRWRGSVGCLTPPPLPQGGRRGAPEEVSTDALRRHPGFCYSAPLERSSHGHILTPGQYVGAPGGRRRAVRGEDGAAHGDAAGAVRGEPPARDEIGRTWRGWG